MKTIQMIAALSHAVFRAPFASFAASQWTGERFYEIWCANYSLITCTELMRGAEVWRSVCWPWRRAVT